MLFRPLCASLLGFCSVALIFAANSPRETVPLHALTWPENYRLHIEFSGPAGGVVRWGENMSLTLKGAAAHDVAIEHPANEAPVIRVWSDQRLVRGPEAAPALLSGTAHPVIESVPGVTVTSAWVQALETADHSELVRGWNEKTLAEGKEIYASLCIVCHGTKEQPGSLPTALRFHEGQFKNGSDPFSMYLTLAKGFGHMVPQSQYTTRQKYSVIQYIREAFLRQHPREPFAEITPDYLVSLPKALARAPTEQEDRRPPPYQRMDFGPAMFWTFEVAPGNIAYKGLALRLDEGPGGVSRGSAWMVYDHDTMRVAAATTGDFVDWKGIAFDGSHGTHTRLTGDPHFVNPVGPGWANPETGKWDDVRLRGRDALPYGPLPRSWANYRGLYLNGSRAVLSYTVGETEMLDSPGLIQYGTTPVFFRTLNVGPAKKPLALRIATDDPELSVMLRRAGPESGWKFRNQSNRSGLERNDGIAILHLPADTGTRQVRIYISRLDAANLGALIEADTTSFELQSLTHGGPPRWPQEIITSTQTGDESDAFVVDTFPLPEENPWQSWMRPSGFDFTPDGRSATVATWNGDVWRVSGISAGRWGEAGPEPISLRWRRIASGLFQPLGVKFRRNELFIACRDQIARLRDFNGDGETDFIENFNNDHQVTEHFHEFAMGLQTDAAGNFYYAKSARHALPALVPHHGTLLRVSADGTHTDILATGFRAANGVCLNDDGMFFVTDQEGHWTPKNRINRVRPGGFYGNMFAYSDVVDTADAAMESPMVWITNAKDRSPAELLWVPKDTWGPFGGALLNLSYGTGRIFVVPHEKAGGIWQGAVCELPIPAFATGIMRGRFGIDGALYACGMFAWAGNAIAPGGFHRIRRTEKPAHVPLAVHPRAGGFDITFSDPLDAASVLPGAFALKIWSLKRSANYGSPHIDEQSLPIIGAGLGADGRTIHLEIPNLAPTPCYELTANLRSENGVRIERSLHGTIHTLADVSHQSKSICGWTVMVSDRLVDQDKASTAKALELLDAQLKEIVRVVPAAAVAKLREVTLWFSPEYHRVSPRAEYHPNREWLVANHRNPAMAQALEFTNVRIFEAETNRMPNLVLHELAHAYHDRVLGFQNAEIKTAYERANAGKRYDAVERWHGNGRPNTIERAYAMTDPQEYFAESTEAFFGRNDFFPFTREELRKHDPEMCKLIERLWQATAK
ncbi:MAG: DUF6797 domain-containing protein [Verrucomicrobiales bacterium]